MLYILFVHLADYIYILPIFLLFVYITFDKYIVSLSKFKLLQDECILALTKKYPDFYFELLPDIEFTGLEENLNSF